MSFVDNDHVIEALLRDGVYPLFRVSIGAIGANRCADQFDVLCSKDVIEGGGELGIPVMEEKPKGSRLVFKRPTKLTHLLVDPAGGWMFRTTGNVDTTRAQFNEEEDINCFQPERFDGEKVMR